MVGRWILEPLYAMIYVNMQLFVKFRIKSKIPKPHLMLRRILKLTWYP
jgi:hypothetical protein